MKQLDKNEQYYLGDLSTEQARELYHKLDKSFKDDNDLDWFMDYYNDKGGMNSVRCNSLEWEWCNDSKYSINALTLFDNPTNRLEIQYKSDVTLGKINYICN